MIKIPNDTFLQYQKYPVKIEKYLRNIDLTKATGSDYIGQRFVKTAESLTYTCN